MRSVEDTYPEGPAQHLLQKKYASQADLWLFSNDHLGGPPNSATGPYGAGIQCLALRPRWLLWVGPGRHHGSRATEIRQEVDRCCENLS
jgi:hypothetical protein